MADQTYKSGFEKIMSTDYEVIRLRDWAIKEIEESNSEIEFELGFNELDKNTVWEISVAAYKDSKNWHYSHIDQGDLESHFLEYFLRKLCETEEFIEAWIRHFKKEIKCAVEDGECSNDVAKDFKRARKLYENEWLTDEQFISILKEMRYSIFNEEGVDQEAKEKRLLKREAKQEAKQEAKREALGKKLLKQEAKREAKEERLLKENQTEKERLLKEKQAEEERMLKEKARL